MGVGSFISIIVTVLIIIGLLVCGFYYGIHRHNKIKKYFMEEEKSRKEKLEKEQIEKEKLIDLFNNLYIGQTLQDIQGLLGFVGELKEERLLREEKLLYDKDVIKKVYVWKFNIGNVIVVIKCTFYNDKLSAKEQQNLD